MCRMKGSGVLRRVYGRFAPTWKTDYTSRFPCTLLGHCWRLLGPCLWMLLCECMLHLGSVKKFTDKRCNGLSTLVTYWYLQRVGIWNSCLQLFRYKTSAATLLAEAVELWVSAFPLAGIASHHLTPHPITQHCFPLPGISSHHLTG